MVKLVKYTCKCFIELATSERGFHLEKDQCSYYTDSLLLHAILIAFTSWRIGAFDLMIADVKTFSLMFQQLLCLDRLKLQGHGITRKKAKVHYSRHCEVCDERGVCK